MGMELVNFAVFFGLVTGFHVCNEKLQHVHKGHVRVPHLTFVAGALSHPITWDTMQHYIIHLVVYSGKLLPLH